MLIDAVPPIMVQSAANPGGQPLSAFDKIRAAIQGDGSEFFWVLNLPFYGYNRPSAHVSQGVRDSFWLQGMLAGFPAAYLCIKRFSETDCTDDLKKIDVPTLFIHGDADQIVPFADSASSKIVRGARLEVYKRAAHWLCTTFKDRVNADLLAVIQASIPAVR